MHIESTLTLITAEFSFRMKRFSTARPNTVPIFFAEQMKYLSFLIIIFGQRGSNKESDQNQIQHNS